MPSFKKMKNQLLIDLLTPDWKQTVYRTLENKQDALQMINPLVAMLPRHEVQWQAAICLGKAVATIATHDMEAARNFMRRMMWSLNEESGNLGWGIPQSMGCIIAQSPPIAKEFGKILVSYIITTGKDDNYLDHAPLRFGVYWGIGHASSNLDALLITNMALPYLLQALDDEDMKCQLMALWALEKALQTVNDQTNPLLDKIKKALHAKEGSHTFTNESITFFDEEKIIEKSGAEILTSFTRNTMAQAN